MEDALRELFDTSEPLPDDQDLFDVGKPPRTVEPDGDRPER